MVITFFSLMHFNYIYFTDVLYFQAVVFHGHRFTMTFSLYTLFEASLLVINGIAVLNEERFLSKSELTRAISICDVQ